MVTRRPLLLASLASLLPAALPVSRAWAQDQSFPTFLEGVRAEAMRSGISPAILSRALRGLQPNQKVIELDRRQPEFTLTWEQYRDGRLSATRIANGQRAYGENERLLDAIESRYRVSPRIIIGIWGLETNFGGYTGNFNTVEALATLAWEGRRASFFRKELLAALRILDEGDVSPERMRGSYAGAMGQPQFMPSSFERLAVDFDGDGRRDIWDDRADALASIANFLARSGWRQGESWGREVRLPANFDPSEAQLRNTRPLREWSGRGVRSVDGLPLPPLELPAAILLPGGPGGQAFAVFPNFNAIRRYNPSSFYALAVGMLGDRVA